MALIIFLYALGLVGLVGVVIEGADHHIMTCAVCIIFATLFLLERRDAQEESEEN